MYIEKLNLINYKCFEGKYTIEFKEGINILVGNNGEGKSTILEGINLALSGLLNGKYLKNEISQYLFNKNIVKKYITDLKAGGKQEILPSIEIELFINSKSPEKLKELAILKGNNNSDRSDKYGIKLEIKFDDSYLKEYEILIKDKEIITLPIEYYQMKWSSFGRDSLTSRIIPLKSILIDSSLTKCQNGSDLYISKIIKNYLDEDKKVGISQAFRQVKEEFMRSEYISKINDDLKEKIDRKKLEISVDLSTQNSWENTLITILDEIPFHQIGRGDQCIIKSKLALQHKKTSQAQILLIEEPENHLSHTKLNELMKIIEEESKGKQVILSTHSPFVANKLGLNNLILLKNRKNMRLTELNKETYKFFKKLPGYNTLRLILSQKSILVEGDSDELIFQKYFMIKNREKLPINKGIDVISCGLAFKRFLEIAILLNEKVGVITDNDGNYSKNIEEKYKDYTKNENIKVFADKDGDLNTLEPQFVNVNDIKKLSDIVRERKKKVETKAGLIDFMIKNKSEWALRVFESNQILEYPEYIKKAVEWCNDEE
ncbi:MULTISPECIES: ATP-dependent nuclease [Bacteria]|uniref:ATP-dependent nuclease n=1 Tax=Bacteria TaxID=2 RepID=UPI00260442F2|nr:AAA family ATPase [uncultured Cetobacterium sp.]